MGGTNSGPNVGYRRRCSWDELYHIDASIVSYLGPTFAVIEAVFKWPFSSDAKLRLDIRKLNQAILLKIAGSPAQRWAQIIEITTSDCHYGGKRYWFFCPQCEKRVRVLGLSNNYFACRLCTNLPYHSQQQGPIRRLINKKHALGYRVFDDYENGGRKKRKGIHRKTYLTLRNKYHDTDRRLTFAMYQRFSD